MQRKYDARRRVARSTPLAVFCAAALSASLTTPISAQDDDLDGDTATDDSFVDAPIVDRQITVLPLAGSRTSSVRAKVDLALQDIAIVVPLSDVEDTANRLSADLEKMESLESLSKELLIDIFVRGSVRGRRKKTVSLTFLDKHGEELSQRSYTGSLGSRGNKGFAAFVAESYNEALASLSEVEAPPEQEVYEGVDPIGIGDKHIEEDLERPYLPVINMQVLIGARNRDALVRLRSSFTRTYDALFFTELGIRLHARPYGNKRRDIQGIFIDAEFALAPFFTSVDDFGGVFDSSTVRFSGDVGYRLRLGNLELGPAVGFGVDSFSIDERGRDPGGTEAENLVLPSATYWYLRGGVVGELPIMDRLLSVQATAGFRYALGMGDLVPTFGASGTALGFDVGLIAGGALDMGFTYSAWLRYVTYGISFSGNASNLAENGNDGHDRAVYFGVALGYEFYDD